MKILKVLLAIIILFCLFFITLYTLDLRIFQVRGNLMSPNFPDKSYLLVKKYSYQFTNLSRSDVVIYKSSEAEPETDSLIRLIGFPGETIKIIDGDIFINDKKFNETAYGVLPGTTDIFNYYQKNPGITVPANSYYALTDQRKSILDSRKWGFLSSQNIRYVVQLCIWNCPASPSNLP